MRATVLTALILFVWSLQGIAQSPAPSFSETPASEAQVAAESTSELKLVVALFRHGVRAPLKEIDDPKKKPHAAKPWPTLDQWGAAKWGYLTPHGRDLAQALGSYYAKWYTTKDTWPNGFKAYLWADTDPRTIDTANALAFGLRNSGIPNVQVTVASLPSCTPSPTPCPADPLFHPFKARCGKPDASKLGETVTKINKARQEDAQDLQSSFKDLYGVLDCFADLSCVPLETAAYTVERCTDTKDSPEKCESPITWSENISGKPGPFPYASTASETFLLEYANNMVPNLVGWGKVDAAKNLVPMMRLHETYFDLSEREPYPAQIQGSNLIREILDQLKRKANQPPDGKCPRGNPESDFVGLIGHDTNLANVNKLLKLEWKFVDKNLPRDTSGLPANDALPAGALVFELRQRNDGYVVRVEYVTQSLEQMRNGPPVSAAFRLPVQGGPCGPKQPCEIPLDTFNRLVANALGPNNPFLSRCSDGGNQVCQ